MAEQDLEYVKELIESLQELHQIDKILEKFHKENMEECQFMANIFHTRNFQIQSYNCQSGQLPKQKKLDYI